MFSCAYVRLDCQGRVFMRLRDGTRLTSWRRKRWRNPPMCRCFMVLLRNFPLLLFLPPFAASSLLLSTWQPSSFSPGSQSGSLPALLFNSNSRLARRALGDPSNSHSGCWGVRQCVTPSWLRKYIIHDACDFISVCMSACARVREPSWMYLSKLFFLL